MKDILFLTIRVEADSQFDKISDTIQELENEAIIVVSDTPNIRIIESEILLTRFRKLKN